MKDFRFFCVQQYRNSHPGLHTRNLTLQQEPGKRTIISILLMFLFLCRQLLTAVFIQLIKNSKYSTLQPSKALLATYHAIVKNVLKILMCVFIHYCKLLARCTMGFPDLGRVSFLGCIVFFSRCHDHATII